MNAPVMQGLNLNAPSYDQKKLFYSFPNNFLNSSFDLSVFSLRSKNIFLPPLT